MLAYRTGDETSDLEYLMLGLMAIFGVAAAVFVLSTIVAWFCQLGQSSGGIRLSGRQVFGQVEYKRGGLPGRVMILLSAIILSLGVLAWLFIRSSNYGAAPITEFDDIRLAADGAASALLFAPYALAITAVGAISWKLLYGRSAHVKWSRPYHVTKEHRHRHRHHGSGHIRPSELVEPAQYSELESRSERPRLPRRRWFDPDSY